LSFLRPTAAGTALLRACLLEGERGKEALTTWLRSAPSADLLRPAGNRLFPLLAEAARRSEIALDPFVRSRLRAALASEEVRYEGYCQLLGPALAALLGDGVDILVLKGAAIAETVYPRPQLRHSHDIDVLVAPRQHAGAVARLQRLGWQRERAGPESDTDSFVHAFGLPLCVHTRWIRGSLGPTDFAALRSRARRIRLAGVLVPTPSPADALLHILGQAVTSGTFRSLVWACDAFFCVDRSEEMDWHLFARELRKSPLAPAYLQLLGYLHDNLDLALPGVITEALGRGETGLSWPDCEILIASLDAGAFGRRRMWAASRWATRMLLLKWLLWPRSDVARAISPDVPPWRLPFDNLRRVSRR
jgi:hypothetical protein